MKKAKIILTAIAMLMVVGGGLSFKAKRSPIIAYSSIGVTVTSTTIGNVILLQLFDFVHLMIGLSAMKL